MQGKHIVTLYPYEEEVSLLHSLMYNTFPAVLRVPTAALVETYSTSTQHLMHVLSTNTYILLHLHNSIMVNHIFDFFFTNHGTNFQLKTFYKLLS